jgi:hypothetical protein
MVTGDQIVSKRAFAILDIKTKKKRKSLNGSSDTYRKRDGLSDGSWLFAEDHWSA